MSLIPCKFCGDEHTEDSMHEIEFKFHVPNGTRTIVDFHHICTPCAIKFEKEYSAKRDARIAELAKEKR